MARPGAAMPKSLARASLSVGAPIRQAVQQFVSTRCYQGAGQETLLSELTRSYNRWADFRRGPTATAAAVATILRELGFDVAEEGSHTVQDLAVIGPCMPIPDASEMLALTSEVTHVSTPLVLRGSARPKTRGKQTAMRDAIRRHIKIGGG